MRIHLPGDWAAPIAFGLTATALIGMSFSPGAEAVVGPRILGACFAIFTLIGVAAAYRGRKIAEGAISYWWSDLGMDFFSIVGGAGLFYLGSMLLVWQLGPAFEIGPFVISAAFGIGFLWLAYSFLLQAHIVVFTPDKQVVIFFGRPLTFRRRTFSLADFTSLTVRTHRAYAGTYGMITTWQRVYEVVANSKHRNVVFGVATSEKEARAKLAELAKLTRLPAADFPTVTGKDTTHSISA